MGGRVTQSVTTTTLTRQRARFGADGKFLRGATGDGGFNYLQVWAVDVVGGVVRVFVEGWSVRLR